MMEIKGKGNGILISQKCEFTNNGHPLRGIREATIIFELGGVVEMVATMYVEEIDLSGVAMRFQCADPVSGEIKQVTRIEYADGSEWNDD